MRKKRKTLRLFLIFSDLFQPFRFPSNLFQIFRFFSNIFQLFQIFSDNFHSFPEKFFFVISNFLPAIYKYLA